MTKYTERRLSGLLSGGDRLKEGEVSISTRVRCQKQAAEWWQGLTPEQRGAAVVRAHASALESAPEGIAQKETARRSLARLARPLTNKKRGK